MAEPGRLAVDLVVRADAERTTGGDMVQVEEYVRRLDPARFDVRVVPFAPRMRLRPGSVVHVVNIDRPHDFLAATRAARGHRLIVSPIHHDAGRVLAMRRADRDRGMTSVLTRVLPDPVREWLGTARRAVRAADGPASLAAGVQVALVALAEIPGVWRRAGRVLDRADLVALLAEGEGAALMALSGWHGRNRALVPNGRPDADGGAAGLPWADRPVGSILVVGRIEPRKRQLEVARAADRLRIPVRFIGPHTDEGTALSREFAALAATSPFVLHEGAMPRPDVLARMGASRVLLNASWVEVQSLVDLEAALLGCAVVTSGTGHSAEWLGDVVTDVPDGGIDALLRAAAARAAGDEPPPPVRYDATWDAAATRLAAAYAG
ncbi:glycosyltransferase [uncultured Amnibacterium sp.]|uniref:glycosyltransferase n=1 Tax=uncultured Amnibacterium sp. TaxID=1631851 RepID=UPI0035CA316D